MSRCEPEFKPELKPDFGFRSTRVVVTMTVSGCGAKSLVSVLVGLLLPLCVLLLLLQGGVPS